MRLFYGPIPGRICSFFFNLKENSNISAIYCPILKRFCPYAHNGPGVLKKKRISGRPGDHIYSRLVDRKQDNFSVARHSRAPVVY